MQELGMYLEKDSPKKVRVLQVVSGISTEGIGTFILNTFEAIDKKQFEISFALATEWEQHHEKRIIENGGKIYRTYEIGKGIKGKVLHFINLIKLLKKEGPFDIVHSQMDFFNGINMFAAFLAGVPIRISHAHLAIGNDYLSIQKKLYDSIMRILIKIFSTDRLACSSPANDYIHRSSKKNKVLYNGINLEKFATRGIKSIPTGLDIDRSKINFITIGRIDEPKNPKFLIHLIKEMADIRKDFHLYWVGSGSQDKEIKELALKLGITNHVSFLGVRDDIAVLLSNMDFKLLPSKWEALPIVLLEAQASGLPCFISNTISNDVDLGMCTALSIKDSPKNWAKQINEHINNNLFNNELDQTKLKRFDIKWTTKELEAIYKK